MHTSSFQPSTIGDIPADSRHTDKVVSPTTALALPRAYLKWYDVHRFDQPVADEMRDRARAFIQAEATAGQLDFADELGFVILHRSGDVHFLIVCVWRSINEMWQALYFSDGGEFRQYPQEDKPLRPTQCVWELGPTAHERQAWARYLHSARDNDAKLAYVADLYRGSV